ncbi:MAG: hypothetical protein IPL26_13425 [Leptospiraceae bacterium]|nr:hypothetical protein [Leptospiraceae bacterium]
MIETKRTKPKKKNIVVSLIKALSEKSAKEFQDDISTGKLYDELKPGKEKK